VAVLGSLLSSVYSARVGDSLHGLPPALVSAARDSVGTAGAVAARIGGEAGQALVNVANAAFIHAMDVTVLVGAGVALAGALVALLFLPARAQQPAPEIAEPGASEVGVHVG
jgi:hypothetical protein